MQGLTVMILQQKMMMTTGFISMANHVSCMQDSASKALDKLIEERLAGRAAWLMFLLCWCFFLCIYIYIWNLPSLWPRPSLDFPISLWSARCLSTWSSASGCIWSMSLCKAHRQQHPLQDVSGSQCFLNWMEEIEECLLLRTWTSTKSTVARAASTRQHVEISGKQLETGRMYIC